jgi:hypothetical protein
MVFDGAINGINVLINWKQTSLGKSNSPQTQKNSFSIDGIKRQNHWWHAKIPYPTCPTFPALCLRTNWSMKGQWGQWQMQSLANRFSQKQPAFTPETRFFSIDGQWQKPLTLQKNLIP